MKSTSPSLMMKVKPFIHFPVVLYGSHVGTVINSGTRVLQIGN